MGTGSCFFLGGALCEGPYLVPLMFGNSHMVQITAHHIWKLATVELVLDVMPSSDLGL